MIGPRAQGKVQLVRRDYSLTGPDAKAAVAAGFDNAEWYRAPIDPVRLQELMSRRNARPTLDAIAWLALIAGFGAMAFVSLGTWWAVPAFGAFGVLGGGQPTRAGTRTGTARPLPLAGRTTPCTTSRRL